MKNKKVLLIYPPLDSGYFMSGVNDSPPLGLVVLHNYVLDRMGDNVSISIVDGEHTSLDEVISVLKSSHYDIVGIQPMMASYNATLDLLAAAKKSGALTVLGGHHATQLAVTIVKNRKEIVDCVISGDGEIAFLNLVQGVDFNKIPNLVYWDYLQGKVVRNPEVQVPIDDGAILHFPPELLALYRKSTEKYERGSSVSFRTYSHKGCQNRSNSQYCYFCGRADKGFRYKTPEIYLEEIRYLVEVCHADYIFEIGDDFLQNEDWLTEVIELKERKYPDLQTNLKIFARANRINQSIIDLLKRINITEVAIGFESGSEEVLKAINKNCTSEQNIKAAEILFRNKIDTVASYVLGLPGETDETLEKTLHQARYLRELAIKYLGHPPQEIIGNLIEINPGSYAFREILHAFPEKYRGNDILGIKETQDDYFKVKYGFTTDKEIAVFREKLARYSKKLNSLGRYTYPAGWVLEDML